MGFLDYIKPVDTIDCNEAQAKIADCSPEEYCLLDVRQLKEYEAGHLPGAVLIPINELHDRWQELNSNRMTIVYCAIGGRSRAGASILQDNGFREVYNLKGGTKAWNGLTVTGPPETGMAHFLGSESVEDILITAWALEEGARRFYRQLADHTGDDEAKRLFAAMAEAEVGHESTIEELFKGLFPSGDHLSFADRYLQNEELQQLMEGQLRISDVVAWAKVQPLENVLEYAIGLEAGVYDLYMRLADRFRMQPLIYKIYMELAYEEKDHLDKFTRLLESRI